MRSSYSKDFENIALHEHGHVKKYGDEPVNGLDYYSELHGMDGLWICFFVPPMGRKEAQEKADAALVEARKKWDIVRSNWCFAQPGEGTAQ